jgi:hypothetical protein
LIASVGSRSCSTRRVLTLPWCQTLERSPILTFARGEGGSSKLKRVPTYSPPGGWRCPVCCWPAGPKWLRVLATRRTR